MIKQDILTLNENHIENIQDDIKIIYDSNKEDVYSFYINNNKRNKNEFNYKNNEVVTTKYNIITFLPKALLFQFMRLANVYFLFTAILSCIKIISPLSPLMSIFPICFVISVSLIREFIEDFYRFKLDQKQNNIITYIYDNKDNQFKEIKTSKLEVGNIVKVNENESFPADLILLDSSLNEGICYIETSSLDGEKTLKIKQANHSTIEIINDLNKCIYGYGICDKPNPYIYQLKGKLKIYINNKIIDVPISLNQLLLKGAKLKNTNYIIGLVIYTGNNCKIIQNSKNIVYKYSKLETKMNRYLIGIFIFQILLCILSAIMHSIYYNKYLVYNSFFNNLLVKNVTFDSFLSFFSYILLLNTMIPISLIITLELIKTAQGIFIKLDVKGYSPIRQVFIEPHTINLNEECGMVSHIFTDKTGTLTCNKMEIKYCVIGKKCYEYIKKNNTEDIQEEKELIKFINSSNMRSSFKSNIILDNNENNDVKIVLKKTDKYIDDFYESKHQMVSEFPDEDFITNMKESSPVHNKIIKFEDGEMQKLANKIQTKIYNDNLNFKENEKLDDINLIYKKLNIINEYWKALALCHDCGFKSDTLDEYIGINPDNIALVKAAKHQYYTYIQNPGKKTSIRRIRFGMQENRYIDYEVLLHLEFSSERKRESIIVKENDIIKLYIKGADTEIEKRLSSNSSSTNLINAKINVEHFSTLGYRTLFIAMKILTENEYLKYKKLLDKVILSTMDNQDTVLNNIYDQIESNLFLLGVSIVEDKLQDEVPETIRDLQLAGIKIWMLTGDKMSTAFNIALSCNLIAKSMITFFIEGKEFQRDKNLNILNINEAEQIITDFVNKFEEFKNEYKIEDLPKYSLLIDENAFMTISYTKRMSSLFISIAKDAASVICCRVSPLQKSKIIKEVKKYDPNKITLAIGDGGNDVSMILEADIGVGIYGEEGLRAVQNSDYSMGEFKILRRLLLFHGRVNNIRISKAVLYFFYKNFIFTIVQFYFSFYSTFSGQTIIDDWLINLYNLLFTAFPLGVRACTDFDVKPEDGSIINQLLPFLYAETRDYPLFNKFSFYFNILKGSLYGLINFIISIISYNSKYVDSNGKRYDIWCMSTLIYTNIILIVTLTIVINTRYFTHIYIIVIFILSLGCYIIFLFMIQNINLFNSFATIVRAMTCPQFYLSHFLVTSICFLIDLMEITYKINFNKKLCYSLSHLIKDNKEINKRDIDDRNILKCLKKYEEYNQNDLINERCKMDIKRKCPKILELSQEINSSLRDY